MSRRTAAARCRSALLSHAARRSAGQVGAHGGSGHSTSRSGCSHSKIKTLLPGANKLTRVASQRKPRHHAATRALRWLRRRRLLRGRRLAICLCCRRPGWLQGHRRGQSRVPHNLQSYDDCSSGRRRKHVISGSSALKRHSQVQPQNLQHPQPLTQPRVLLQHADRRRHARRVALARLVACRQAANGGTSGARLLRWGCPQQAGAWVPNAPAAPAGTKPAALPRACHALLQLQPVQVGASQELVHRHPHKALQAGRQAGHWNSQHQRHTGGVNAGGGASGQAGRQQPHALALSPCPMLLVSSAAAPPPSCSLRRRRSSPCGCTV